MTRTMQTAMAVCLFFGTTILIGSMLYLVYVFPSTEAIWVEQGTALSAVEVFVVDASNLAKHYGRPILGGLVFLLLASLVWLTASLRTHRNASA